MPLIRLVALSVGSVAPLTGATTTLTFGILARNTQHQEVTSPTSRVSPALLLYHASVIELFFLFAATVQRYPPLYFMILLLSPSTDVVSCIRCTIIDVHVYVHIICTHYFIESYAILLERIIKSVAHSEWQHVCHEELFIIPVIST